MNLNSDMYIHGGKQKNYYSMEEVIECKCPYCGQEDTQLLYKERGEIGISQCRNCGLIFTNPRTKDPEQVYWGDGDKYKEEAKFIFAGKAKHHRYKNYLHDLKIIKKYKPDGKFLDVGSNMGFFVNYAKEQGWDVIGVEPSPSLSKICGEIYQIKVINSFLEKAEFDEKSFDVVTMTDVFEHVTNPQELLQESYRILKNDGVIFIKVPNVEFSLLKLKIFKLLGKTKQYDIFDSYEHVVHYNMKTIRKMLESQNFEVLNIYVDLPVQIPVWHHYIGHYYLHESPFCLDRKHYTLRRIVYLLARIEYLLKFRRFSSLAPNISIIAKKK